MHACLDYLIMSNLSEIGPRNWVYLRVSSKGLNTKSINLNVPRRRCSSSWLRNNTAEMDAQCYPGSGPSCGGKTPTSCFWWLVLLGEITSDRACRALGGYNGVLSLDLYQELTPRSLLPTSSFYRCPGPHPPKCLGGKGYHMATKEEAGCTIKRGAP